mmetsp:Transcript_43104/g.107678  ORF Transcript_43104/g.107678 Transcript_43104/m.107678 type:complete len:256 (-) Transcript_43104:61-828(-)
MCRVGGCVSQLASQPARSTARRKSKPTAVCPCLSVSLKATSHSPGGQPASHSGKSQNTPHPQDKTVHPLIHPPTHVHRYHSLLLLCCFGCRTAQSTATITTSSTTTRRIGAVHCLVASPLRVVRVHRLWRIGLALRLSGPWLGGLAVLGCGQGSLLLAAQRQIVLIVGRADGGRRGLAHGHVLICLLVCGWWGWWGLLAGVVVIVIVVSLVLLVFVFILLLLGLALARRNAERHLIFITLAAPTTPPTAPRSAAL